MPSKPCKFGVVNFDLSLSLCYNDTGIDTEKSAKLVKVQ